MIVWNVEVVYVGDLQKLMLYALNSTVSARKRKPKAKLEIKTQQGRTVPQDVAL